jgi:hypothetical protein
VEDEGKGLSVKAIRRLTGHYHVCSFGGDTPCRISRRIRAKAQLFRSTQDPEWCFHQKRGSQKHRVAPKITEPLSLGSRQKES